jgi:hypothetical protein
LIIAKIKHVGLHKSASPTGTYLLFELGVAAEVVDIAGRQAGYCPVDPLLEGASAPAAVFEFQQIPAAVLDAYIVYQGKLPPPPLRRLVLKLIVYFGY